MILFLVRVLNFTVVPLLVAFILLRLEPKPVAKAQRNELYLIYLFGLGVAGSGIGGFFGHIFLADVVAQSVGWPSGSPFQLEMGFANLALGVLGIMATSRQGGFRTATTIAATVIGLGAALVHFYDILQTGNLAPGNTIQNVANLARPALLILFLRAQQKLSNEEVTSMGLAQWEEWRNRQAQGAGIVTAMVATGFGLGFAFQAPALGSIAGIGLGLALMLWLRSTTGK